MKEFLGERAVFHRLASRDKEGALRELVEKLSCAFKGIDTEVAMNRLTKREKMSSTGLGDGVAIPHAVVDGMASPALAFGISSEGIDFDSLDGKPANFVFLYLSPDGCAGTRLRTFAAISRIIRCEGFREKMLETDTPEMAADALYRFDSSTARPAVSAW